MSQMNPYPDNYGDYPVAPPKSKNGATIVILIVVLLLLLVMIAGGVLAVGLTIAQQQKQRNRARMARQRAVTQRAIVQNPTGRNKYFQLRQSRQYKAALAELDKLLAQNPEDAHLHNEKGWILSTCPDDSVRNGQLALVHAKKSCQLTQLTNAAYVDTLAAAHAELGQFDSAVQFQTKAMGLANAASKADYLSRLQLYQAKQPYRQLR